MTPVPGAHQPVSGQDAANGGRRGRNHAEQAFGFPGRVGEMPPKHRAIDGVNVGVCGRRAPSIGARARPRPVSRQPRVHVRPHGHSGNTCSRSPRGIHE